MSELFPPLMWHITKNSSMNLISWFVHICPLCFKKKCSNFIGLRGGYNILCSAILRSPYRWILPWALIGPFQNFKLLLSTFCHINVAVGPLEATLTSFLLAFSPILVGIQFLVMSLLCHIIFTEFHFIHAVLCVLLTNNFQQSHLSGHPLWEHLLTCKNESRPSGSPLQTLIWLKDATKNVRKILDMIQMWAGGN